jgi:hypothetical protein
MMQVTTRNPRKTCTRRNDIETMFDNGNCGKNNNVQEKIGHASLVYFV